eukprot:TRINITY_DN1570_c0_g1_i1.p1 TRINITY_DN1570_c0_g1~~TRINITY_DN1570_c0_g1_i1.p1  ORF type:complete len:1239 (+),score=192.08 TRINITY_DN1570_c0_g1_i1:276-3992(+)
MPPTENRRSGRKRRTPARLADQPPEAKKPRREPKSRNQDAPATVTYVHKPCDQILFSYDEHVHWKPHPKDIKTLKCLENIHAKRSGNLHSYFITSTAAKDAARATDRVRICRHIGSVTLRQCSFGRSARNAQCLQPPKLADDRPNDPRINFVQIIDGTKSSNSDLLQSLESLAYPDADNWNVPYIVLLANREDVIKAMTSRTRLDITLQVYAGRLLFELIACDDIKTLFEALQPTHPFKNVPTLPQFPASFPRSELNAETSEHSCEAILQRAESTGYQSLSDVQRHKIESTLTVTLFPFQEQTVRWMLDKENDEYYLNDYFWEERFFTKVNGKESGSFFYFPLTGEVRLNRPPRMRGGMVTEEMGLGKTVEALALISAQREKTKLIELDVHCSKKPNDFNEVDGVLRMKRLKAMNREQPFSEHIFHHGDKVRSHFLERSFPQKVTVTRWTPQTTLVICPQSLLGQWRQEAISKAPSLSVYVWGEDEDDDMNEDCDRSSFAIGEGAVDIVLTTYESVRRDPMLSMITWRRVILDEAQHTRRSSAQIARDVFNLRSNTRFLMTGTPVVNSLDDFKGELATLKIWPFTLENDGFWEQHILEPMRRGLDTSLLTSLLDVTMIRHTKGQGLHLSLPERQYETIEVDLVGSHRSCYCYILAITLEELESQVPGAFDSRRLRLLLKFLLWVSLSPSLVDVSSLDIARRHIWARRERLIHGRRGDDEDPEMRQLSGRSAIEFVASTTSGIVRQTFRTFAMDVPPTSSETANVLEEYLHMSLDRLRQEVIDRNVIPKDRVPLLRRERLAALAAGGVHRLATDSLQELRHTAIRVGVVTLEQAAKLTRSSAMAKLQAHYDRENGIQMRNVHESGFVALTKLIEGKGNPTCPVCLTECDDRVTVTKCGHLYCHGCMSLILSTKDSHGYYRKPKCAICRRELTQNLVAEIIRKEPDPAPNASVDGVEIKREVLVPKQQRPIASKGKKRRTRRRSSRKAAPVAAEVQAENGAPDIVMPTANEAWTEYSQLGEAPDRFRNISQSSMYPSIDASYLQHLQATNHGLESPKLSALLQLIQSCPATTKFCVVASSLMSLAVVQNFLKKNGIICVGVGVTNASSGTRKKSRQKKTKEMTDASEAFATNPLARVFLLNPATCSGLNLIAAEYVVFLETLVRVADEIQASARVHRIGQTKKVKIVRIVARNTIDENIAWERREASTPAQESQIMAAQTQRDSSDSLILRLFGHVLQQE